MEHAKLGGQTLLYNRLAKFLGTPTEHTDPLTSMNIWRSAHLHRWVFMVRSCSCSQFNSSDPKAPDVCLEIISSDLKKYQSMLSCAFCCPTLITIPFTHPFPTNLESPALQRWKHFLPSLPPAPHAFKEMFQKSQSGENHYCALYNQDCSAINSTAEHKGALGSSRL